MSDLVHISNSLVCPMPEVEFHPNRNAFDAKRSLRNFWSALEGFGQQHCIFGCAQCEGRMEKKSEDEILCGDNRNYLESFNHAHNVVGQLPDDVYQHLVSLANGKCPVCAVLVALQQFPQIAKHSESPLFTELSVPCFWSRETDRTGWNYDIIVRHVDALLYLDLDELPPKLTPADEHEIRELLVPGKAVVRFIQDIIEGKIQPSPMMTDDELWTILRWRKFHSEPALEVTDAWEAWAKKAFMAGAKWSSDDVCRLILVAVNCYENLAMTGESIDGFIDGRGLDFDRLLEIFNSVACLCSDEMYDPKFFYSMLECWKSTFLSWDALTRGKIYISLAIPGKLSAEKSCGKPPPFFQWDVRPLKSNASPETTIITQSAIKNDANATGFGIGTGGKGGDGGTATVAIKKDVAIEKGAIKQENNQTVNVNGDSAELVRELRGLLNDEHERRSYTPPKKPILTPSPGSDVRRNQQLADAALWAEWQRKRGEGVTKTEFSLEKGITVGELQAALDRHRDVKNGMVTPNPESESPDSSSVPPVPGENGGDQDPADGRYDGPEPATTSPEKQLDPKTMITRPEIVTLLNESKHTWNWIAPTLEKMKIEPCFIPRLRRTPDAYWRSEIEKAIAAKRETD